MTTPHPRFEDVRAAGERIAPYAVRTSVIRSDVLDQAVDAAVLMKCEHRQHTGSFKYRGATNAVQSLDDSHASRGVATHSSGNHGQALAAAAQIHGIACHVVMPHDSTVVKREGVVAHGGLVYDCDATMVARIAGLEAVLTETGATVVHPFSDPRVIAGQGTATLELLTDHPEIDIVLTPVGGGGLIGGTAIAAHGIDPRIRVVGAEPDGARDAHDSLATGVRVTHQTPDTICDGLRGTVGEINLAIMQRHEVEILLVSDDEVRTAMWWLQELTGEIVEPSSATTIAALCRYPDIFAGHSVGVILTGGNLDSG